MKVTLSLINQVFVDTCFLMVTHLLKEIKPLTVIVRPATSLWQFQQLPFCKLEQSCSGVGSDIHPVKLVCDGVVENIREGLEAVREFLIHLIVQFDPGLSVIGAL